MKSHLLIYSLIGVISIIAWVFLALIPNYGKYNAVASEIYIAEQKLADFHQTILLLPEFIKTRNELAQRKAALNSSLYTKENILSLFEKLYLLADKNQVEIVEVTPPIEELLQINRITPDSIGLMFLNIALRIEGNYEDYGKFVSAIESEPFYRGPNHCNITSTYDRRLDVQYHIGFKSLLGSLKDEV